METRISIPKPLNADILDMCNRSEPAVKKPQMCVTLLQQSMDIHKACAQKKISIDGLLKIIKKL